MGRTVSEPRAIHQCRGLLCHDCPSRCGARSIAGTFRSAAVEPKYSGDFPDRQRAFGGRDLQRRHARNEGDRLRGGTRVPAFWRWPGRLPGGTDCAALTAHIDLFPTLASLAGADITPVRNQVEGRSLVPLLEHPQAPWADRLLVTHFGRWDYGEAPAARYRLCAIRTPASNS